MTAVFHFVILWAIYGLAIFMLSVVGSVIRGAWNGVKLRYAMAVGLMGTILHELVLFYLRHF